jgi:hypothetical protein
MGFPIGDSVWMGGQKSPGSARIRKAGDPRTWDVRKGYGFSGAYAVFTGDDLSKFSIDFALWTPDQFDDWRDFAKVLAKPTTAKARTKAIGIYHPVLRVPPLNIKAVVVLDCSQFDVDETGLWMCSVDLMVFRPPKPALARPPAAIPGVAKPAPTAQDAADKKIQQLVGQVGDLL